MFNVAREVSLMSDFSYARLGAVVCEGKRIISTGCNSNKTRPLQHRYNRYRHFQNYDDAISKEHAETAALSHLIGKEIDWSKVSIYTYRETRDGKRACSRPCPACSRLIKELGIKNIYFLDENGNYTKERVL